MLRPTAAVNCSQCGNFVRKKVNEINRAKKAGLNLYCGRACDGMARRRKVELTEVQKKDAKRLYDMQYRARVASELKAKKAAYYESNKAAIKAKAKVYRKKNMPRHLAYCQRPEYKQYKAKYDLQYRAKEYGEFADAYLLLMSVNKEIAERATREQIYQVNGTTNKSLKRKRELWAQTRRN